MYDLLDHRVRKLALPSASPRFRAQFERSCTVRVSLVLDWFKCCFVRQAAKTNESCHELQYLRLFLVDSRCWSRALLNHQQVGYVR